MLRDHARKISLQLVDCDFGMRRRPRHISKFKSKLKRPYTVIPAISFIEAAVNSRFMRPMKAAGTLAGHTASQA